MIRTLFLVLTILAVAVMPNSAHAGGHGGGHGGRGFHGHHGGFRHHHHGFHSFVGVGVFAPWPWCPYDYPYYPYAYPPPVVYQPPAVQREVIYPNGKYVLYGDGVTQPYQWVWIPAAPPPPSPPPSD